MHVLPHGKRAGTCQCPAKPYLSLAPDESVAPGAITDVQPGGNSPIRAFDGERVRSCLPQVGQGRVSMDCHGWFPALRLLAAMLVTAGTSGPALAAATGAKPNILFIMIDTLRPDHVGCYGYQRQTTPNLDRLAAGGVRFDQMIAASSWTTPSVMSMFTSLPPSLHGVTGPDKTLVGDATTLAAELKRAGYQTVGFTSNPCTHSKLGYARGFDLYDDFTVMLSSDLNLFEDFDQEKGILSTVTSPTINRLALSWLEQKRDPGRPFFLYLLYFDPHADYVPPSPYNRLFDPEYDGPENGRNLPDRAESGSAVFTERDRAHIRALYDGDIRFTDEHVGALLKKMEQLKLLENTLTVVVSDHGEEFWEHGGMLHGHTLYEELIHVVCILHWPGKIGPGTVFPQQVSHVDIMPSLLDAMGLPIPRQCRGESFMPCLASPDKPFPRKECFLETEIRNVQLKAIRSAGGTIGWDLKTGQKRGFNLREDPAEIAGVDCAATAWCQDPATRLDAWWQATLREVATRPEPQTITSEIDPRLKKQLKALGYLH